MSESKVGVIKQCQEGGVLVSGPDPRTQVKSVRQLVIGQSYILHACLPVELLGDDPDDEMEYHPEGHETYLTLA
ncbi:MAG TPA: hypothetical protein VD907_06070 [Verrucomicrobiae bacterium]|nr:hypothetical protein [Verrucomicrobiae bacterium]